MRTEGTARSPDGDKAGGLLPEMLRQQWMAQLPKSSSYQLGGEPSCHAVYVMGRGRPAGGTWVVTGLEVVCMYQ